MRLRRVHCLFTALILLDTLQFLLQKFASENADGSGLAYLVDLLCHPWVWIPIALGPLQLWLWTNILGKTGLGRAYGLTSLSYPAAMIGSVLLFREHLPWQVWVGGGLIASGVGLLAATGHTSEEKAETKACQTPQESTP